MLEQLTELAAAASKRRAGDGAGGQSGKGAGAKGAGAGLRVRDVLELSVFAFARLGLSGQAEALADADSPHITIFQSVLPLLLCSHVYARAQKRARILRSGVCRSPAGWGMCSQTLPCVPCAACLCAPCSCVVMVCAAGEVARAC